jgi:hypothetical protein
LKTGTVHNLYTINALLALLSIYLELFLQCMSSPKWNKFSHQPRRVSSLYKWSQAPSLRIWECGHQKSLPLHCAIGPETPAFHHKFSTICPSYHTVA